MKKQIQNIKIVLKIQKSYKIFALMKGEKLDNKFKFFSKIGQNYTRKISYENANIFKMA